MSLQAVYKHLRVLEDAGLVTRPPGPQPRPVRLEVQALDLMDTWIERHRARVEQRYRRLDAVLAQMKETQMRGDENEQDHGDGHRSRPEAAGHPDDS
jgi:DNA-binding MarR family transcriptional regulator